jgi:predicted DNA-binding transcriptional regulator AlpA
MDQDMKYEIQAAEQVIGFKETCELLSMTRFRILALRKAGVFPPAIRIGRRMIGWRVRDLRQWVESRETV